MKRTLAAIALAVLVTGCDSKPDAPFGLKWGQSVDSVKKLGLSGLSCDDGYKGELITCHSGSSPLKQNGKFMLTFNDPKYKGLVTIARSYDSTTDKKLLFEQFNKEKVNLEKEYGAPVKSLEQYDESRDFFFCLSDDSCADIKADYESDGVMSGVKMHSKDKDSGYISVFYIRK